MSDFDNRATYALSEQDTEALVRWLYGARAQQVATVSPGVLAWIVETTRESASTLLAAQDFASGMLRDVMKQVVRPPLEVIAWDFGLESPRYLAIPQEMHAGKPLAAHLRIAHELVEGEKFLVRRLGEEEAQVLAHPQRVLDIDLVYPQGRHGDKAFSIATGYAFKDGNRNKEKGAYDYEIYIRLTRSLKDWLLKFLWVNRQKVNQENFDANPQFKYENGRYNLVVMRKGWISFWERVESFVIVDRDGREVVSEADLGRGKFEAWRARQLAGFHMLDDRPLPPGAMPYIS
jgi:hypothetical protein